MELYCCVHLKGDQLYDTVNVIKKQSSQIYGQPRLKLMGQSLINTLRLFVCMSINQCVLVVVLEYCL